MWITGKSEGWPQNWSQKKQKIYLKAALAFVWPQILKANTFYKQSKVANKLKKIALSQPSTALRPLEGPKEAGDRQGPSAINTEVERNRLSPKKLASASLQWPEGRLRVLRGPDTGRDHQGSMLRSIRTVLAKKNFGLGQP